MGRNLPTATNTAVAAPTGMQCDLIEMQWLGGTVRMATAPVAIAAQVDAGGGVQTWQAVGGQLDIDTAEENTDLDAGGVELGLSGVDNTTVVALLLTDRAIGRQCRIFTARFDTTLGTLIDLPSLRFQGQMNEAWTVTEKRGTNPPEGGNITITTRIPGPMAMLEQAAGILANPASHQAYYAGDLFFSFVAKLIGTRLWWGNFGAWLRDGNRQWPSIPTSRDKRHG